MRSNRGLVEGHLKFKDSDWVVEDINAGYNRYHGCVNSVETLLAVSNLIPCRSA